MVEVTFRYWAAARSAAGVERDVVEAGTVAQALEAAAALHPGEEFARVLRVSSFLCDGIGVRAESRVEELAGPVELEVLPPFAGG